MTESTRTPLPIEGALDEKLVKRAIAAAGEALPGNRVRAGLETAVALAEGDPEAARHALRELQRDHWAMARIEARLNLDTPERATFGLGAAIQQARAELASPAPDLRARLDELLCWLEDDW